MSFNHGVFWPIALPSLTILIIPILYFTCLIDWLISIVGGSFLGRFLSYTVYVADFNLFAWGLIGIAFGLAWIIKDE